MAKTQITNMEVKKNNRNRIFRYICKCDHVSNPDIAYSLKMSLPTVTQNTKELIERGLIEETGEFESTGGRRAKALSVAAGFKVAVGLDITEHHIALVLTNLKGQILKYERLYLPYRAEEAYYREVNGKLEGFLDKEAVERERILGIGISFPGIVDLGKAEITDSHALGVETAVPFGAVSRFFSYPCRFLNDANAGAYAEGIHAEGEARFFYLSLSNTVGGGIFSHGELIQGGNFRCGEVGHMTVVPDGERCYCGRSGCLDAYCAAKCLSGLTDGNLSLFFSELKEGNRALEQAWDRYTTYLAVAVNNIHMVMDCDIILGGYVGSCLEERISQIRDKVRARNTFGEDGGFVKACNYKVGAAALGAALNVIESFIEQV